VSSCRRGAAASSTREAVYSPTDRANRCPAVNKLRILSTNPERKGTALTTPSNSTRTTTISSQPPSRPIRPAVARRISTETKASWKTTEFWVYIAVVIGILIAAQTVGTDSGAANSGNAGDYFRADKAWLYIVLATMGYLLSRGLAKSGSRDFYDDDPRDRDND